MDGRARAMLTGENPAESDQPKHDPQTSTGDANRTYTIGELAKAFGVTLRTLRFYQAKGLLAPTRYGKARCFTAADYERLALILQGKRLHFTLLELHTMLATWEPGSGSLPMSRRQCVEQIRHLERQQRELQHAVRELRDIYNGMPRFGLTDWAGLETAAKKG